jgi:hypothetical protein
VVDTESVAGVGLEQHVVVLADAVDAAEALPW